MNTHVTDLACDIPLLVPQEPVTIAANTEEMPALQIRHTSNETFYPVKIFIDNGRKLIGVNVADIAYCKASRDYTLIITSESEKLLSNKGISTLEKSLDPRYFIRVHRSYIINLRHVVLINSECSKYYFNINNENIPVSRYYLPAVKQLIF